MTQGVFKHKEVEVGNAHKTLTILLLSRNERKFDFLDVELTYSIEQSKTHGDAKWLVGVLDIIEE
jgi:hypothetical protein